MSISQGDIILKVFTQLLKTQVAEASIDNASREEMDYEAGILREYGRVSS